MNIEHLGDALDHFKGSVFALLQEDGLLRDFLVDPMATDASAWNTAVSTSYARLLRVKEDQLVRHRHDLRRDRNPYFSEIPEEGDIFLDPDIGIKTKGSRNQLEKYLRPTELLELMSVPGDRLVVVYQHGSRGRMRQRVQDVWAALKQQDRLFSCSYASPQVALLFFSRTCDRVEAVRDCFRRLLGPHANKRIGWCNS